MAEFMSLDAAVSCLVTDGATVAVGGFAHLVPMAVGHEMIRQSVRGLTLTCLALDLVADQLIGAGCVDKLVFSWGGNPGFGSLPRFRDAVENSWPKKLELEEHSDGGMVSRYLAGASGLPFAVVRSYAGTDLPRQVPSVKPVTCPFSGKQLLAVSALTPDVAIIHAQLADRAGNVRFWGVDGLQREVVLAARKSLVTVEEVVDELGPSRQEETLPGWMVDAVAVVPRGAAPAACADYYERDEEAYRDWSKTGKYRERFADWARRLGS